MALLNWIVVKHSLYFLLPGLIFEIVAIVALGHLPVWQNIASQIGGLLLISGGLSLFWDIRAKRVLIEETLLLADVAANLAESGVRHVGLNYKEPSVWRGLGEARRLVVVASHPNSWRKSVQKELEIISDRLSAHVRFVLPDPNNEQTMQMLAFRDNESPDEAKRSVDEFIAEINGIFARSKADFKICLSSSIPSYTAYRIDDEIVVTLYPQASGRPSAVPTLRIADSAMTQWMFGDIEAALNETSSSDSQK